MAKEWIKAQLGVWEFYYEGRDVRDKSLHPAVYPISLAKKAIELFTHRGELVLDPFVGSGTTLLAAQDLDRNAVGFDISRQYVQLSKDRLAHGRSFLGATGKGLVFLPSGAQQLAVEDDAHNIPRHLEPGSVSLIVTSPPYANLLNRRRLNKSRRGKERQNGQYLKVEQYSQDERDLGTLAVGEYAQAISRIYKAA